MSARPRKQVHPAVSALAILLALGGVQWVWWRFLVWSPPPPNGAGRPSGGQTGQNDVRMLGRADVVVRTIGGDQQPGDADGPAHAARYDRPTGVALDDRGNVYVADSGNHRIRVISPAGDTTTVAGGEPGYADGPSLQARFNAPCGVCVGPDDTIYVADTGNHCIRRIKDGQVTTLAGEPANGGAAPLRSLNLITGIAFVRGAKPLLVAADAGGSRLLRFSTDGTPLGDRAVSGPPVSVFGNLEAAALPSSGTLILGTKTLRDVPFEATDDVAAAEARRLILRHPVGLARLGKGWLVTDNDHGAVLLVVNDKAHVLAGACSSGYPIHGYRDGDGRNCQFGILSGIVSDGKRYAYVADTGGNSIRRLDISEVDTN